MAKTKPTKREKELMKHAETLTTELHEAILRINDLEQQINELECQLADEIYHSGIELARRDHTEAILKIAQKNVEHLDSLICQQVDRIEELEEFEESADYLENIVAAFVFLVAHNCLPSLLLEDLKKAMEEMGFGLSISPQLCIAMATGYAAWARYDAEQEMKEDDE